MSMSMRCVVFDTHECGVGKEVFRREGHEGVVWGRVVYTQTAQTTTQLWPHFIRGGGLGIGSVVVVVVVGLLGIFSGN